MSDHSPAPTNFLDITLGIDTTLDLEAAPEYFLSDAAYQNALTHAASSRLLTTSRTPACGCKLIRCHVEGAAREVIPMLASLHEAGYSYDVEADTQDPQTHAYLREITGGGAQRLSMRGC